MILSNEQRRQFSELWTSRLTAECDRLHITGIAKAQAFGICQVAWLDGIAQGRCEQTVENLAAAIERRGN